jgi:hypothetical protein
MDRQFHSENSIIFHKYAIRPITSLDIDKDCDLSEQQELKRFEEIREKVFETINRIDLIDNKVTVQKLFRTFDYFILLKKEIMIHYNAQIVTNAWLKCYEILSHFKMFQNNSRNPCTITAFFNAELPGAFISATNQYIKTMVPNCKFEWRASSLYGTESNLGDNYGLYKNYPDNWLMSQEQDIPEFVEEQKSTKIRHNGDLTNPENILKIKEQINEVFKNGVMLYTSDGGIGVEEEYTKQEEINAKLNLGQVLCGLLTLAEGGISITKQYMFTYPHTLSLICITSYLFRDLYIVKPMTSRPVNSEIYMVGIGFKANKMTKKLQSHLLDALKNFDFDKSLLPVDCMDEKTLDTVYKAAKLIYGEGQIDAVNKVIDLYFDKSMSEIYNTAKSQYKKAITTYNQNYHLKKIQNSDKLRTV